MKNKLVSKMRQRRDNREFTRAYDQASHSMRQELLAMAQRQGR
jgi:hypothetical protein